MKRTLLFLFLLSACSIFEDKSHDTTNGVISRTVYRTPPMHGTEEDPHVWKFLYKDGCNVPFSLISSSPVPEEDEIKNGWRNVLGCEICKTMIYDKCKKAK